MTLYIGDQSHEAPPPALAPHLSVFGGQLMLLHSSAVPPAAGGVLWLASPGDTVDA